MNSSTTSTWKAPAGYEMTSPSNSPTGAQRRAAIVGTGLIGGSIGMALRRHGWWVTGSDRDVARAQRALQLGAIDQVGVDPGAALGGQPKHLRAESGQHPPVRGHRRNEGVQFIEVAGHLLVGPVFLALGHAGNVAAARFGLTAGRVSQLRREWRQRWRHSQCEDVDDGFRDRDTSGD